MWDENERFVESKARTEKLHCSDCQRKIRKGESVVFKLDTSGSRKPMKDVYCSSCSKEYEYEVGCDKQHPFDLDG